MSDKQSQAALNKLILNHYKQACKIPKEWDPMITEIVTSHMQTLGIVFGNLETCYRRTMRHHEELKVLEDKDV